MIKHKIFWYYMVTLICTIVLGGIAGTLFNASIIEQYAISLALIQTSPLLGVIFICTLSKNWNCFKRLNWNFLNTKRNILWIFISMLIPTFIIACSAFILSAIGKTYVSTGYNFKSLIIIIIASVVGCIGEEIGWRGFMLPEYNKKYSLIISAIYTGMLWGIWHLGKISLYGISGYLLFVLMITEFSIIMAWIYSKTNGNLVYMILFHLSINVVSVLLLTKRESVVFYLVGSLISVMICIAIIVFDRKGFTVLASSE